VTLADFSNVAVIASQDVVRAVCEDIDSGAIRLTILPRQAGQTPNPGFDLISQVETFVRQRALPLLAPLLAVSGPDYVSIDATMTLLLTSCAGRPAVEKAMADAYAAFLNPLTGGASGLGWSFGGRVTAAGVAQMAARIAGVAMVDGVTLGVATLGADLSAIDLGTNQLPAPGALTFSYLDANPV
jgi:pimeloyl-ACP methyl ester carboxylesterase